MICPQCQHANAPRISICPNCGFNSQLGQRAPFTLLSFSWREKLIAAALMIGILGVLAIAFISQQASVFRVGPETEAIQSLRSTHNSQLHYHSVKGRFGTLRELTDEGFLTDKSYASGKA